MIREHEELINAIEIIAETSTSIEKLLEKFRRLRNKEKQQPTQVNNQQGTAIISRAFLLGIHGGSIMANSFGDLFSTDMGEIDFNGSR